MGSIEAATRVLVAAARIDPHTPKPSRSVITGWAQTLADWVHPGDAEAAVVAHYQTNTTRIMPADVNHYAKHQHQQRLTHAKEAGLLDPPPGLDPAAEIAWLHHRRETILNPPPALEKP